MSDNIMFVVLPIFALLVGSLSIAAIWLWWSMSSDEPVEEDEFVDDGDDSEDDEAEAAPAEPTLGEIGDKVKGLVAGLLNRGENADGSGGLVLPGLRSPAPPSGAPAHPVYPPAPLAVDPAGTVPVMRILRDIADGRIVVEIDGQRYRSLSEMTDPEARRRFLGNTHALVSWTKDSMAPAAALPPVPVPAAPDFPAKPAPIPIPADADEEGEEKSMAEQIEQLLQVRLLQNPELKGRSIHIRPSMDGGVVIVVDGTYFDGVGDVADAGVREFILGVIREWEMRQ